MYASMSWVVFQIETMMGCKMNIVKKKMADKFHSESSEGVDAVLRRMVKSLGNPPGGFAEVLDVSENTIKTWRRRGEISPRYLSGFAKAHRLSLDFLLRGARVQDEPQESMSEPGKPFTSERATAQFYKAEVSGPACDPPINGNILTACHAACSSVYGEDFNGLPASDQMTYAADLYNLLVKISAQNGGVDQMARLESSGIASLLSVFIRLGWVRKFPPLPPSLLFD